MNLFLALDQGGHASRALVFDESGLSIARAFAPIATRQDGAGHVEHDPEEIVDSLRAAILDAIRGAGDQGRIVAAGLATQRSSIVCWDRHSGAALSPVISWQDRRNASFVASLRAQEKEIHARTGLVLSPHYGASKLRWCLENLPEVARAAAAGRLALGPLSSFILFRLLAEQPLLVDPANASRTQLWSPSSGKWDARLLDLFGIDAAWLPQPVTSRYAFGTLRMDTSTAPLLVCTGDQSAVPFAFGAARFDTAYINMGTGAFIQCPLREPVLAPPLLTSVIWSDASRSTYALEGTVNGAGSALDWFGDTEGVDGTRMLGSLGQKAQADLQPPLFINGISGLGAPFWVADLPSRYIGRGTPEEKFLAVLESILFLIRVNLDEIRHHLPDLRRIVVTGGLAASDFLCQGLADLSALGVTRYQEREATARGLAFLVADQPQQFRRGEGRQDFAPTMNTGLLERFFAWLKQMKQAVRQADGADPQD